MEYSGLDAREVTEAFAKHLGTAQLSVLFESDFYARACVRACVCVCAIADTYKHTRPYNANALHDVREVRPDTFKRARLHESRICMKYVPIRI